MKKRYFFWAIIFLITIAVSISSIEPSFSATKKEVFEENLLQVEKALKAKGDTSSNEIRKLISKAKKTYQRGRHDEATDILYMAEKRLDSRQPSQPSVTKKRDKSDEKITKALESVKIFISDTKGTYMGQSWHISKDNNVVYWDGKPYVPYGFWGGSIRTGIKCGLKEFDLAYSLGGDLLYNINRNKTTFEKTKRKIRSKLESIVKHGGTYVIPLEPVPGDFHEGREFIRSLRAEDFFAYINKYVVDASRYSGQTRNLEITMPPFQPSALVKVYGAEAYIFDYDSDSYIDISGNINSFSFEKGRRLEERGEGGQLSAKLARVKFPASRNLSLVIIWKVRYNALKGGREHRVAFGAGGYYTLWSPKIVENTRKVWEEMKPVLKTKHLRGINFFNGEVGLSRIFLVHPEEISQTRNRRDYSMGEYLKRTIYPNYNDDVYAIKEYRTWLENKFATISKFNIETGANYQNFNEVKWLLPIRPNNYIEDRNYNRLFGIFASAKNEKRLDILQNEFHQNLFGKWYGEYSKMAKKIFGNVPTFTYTADGSIFLRQNKPKPYYGLDVHIAAIRNGVDGIGLTVYETNQDLAGSNDNSFWNNENLLTQFIAVQRATGKTKLMWVYEGTSLEKQGEEYHVGPTNKNYFREWLNILVNRGVKGFFVGGIFPGLDKSWKGVRKKEWFTSLKKEVVKYAVDTTTMTERPKIASTSSESMESGNETGVVESLARRNPKIRALLREYPDARTSTSYNGQYGIWVVNFFSSNEKIALVSISADKKRVLEVMINVD